MPEIRDPNQETNYNKSNVFNKHFIEYLKQTGWNNEEIRNEMVALVNSIVLSTKGNNSLQKRMLQFFKTALNTLNIELKKLSLNDRDELVSVNPEDVAGDDNPVQESKKKCIDEDCGCSNKSVDDKVIQKTNPNIDKKIINKTNKDDKVVDTGAEFGRDIKTLLFNFKKELEEMDMEKTKQVSIIRKTFDLSKMPKDNKKILLDKLEQKVEAATDFLKSNTRFQINEKDENKDDEEADVDVDVNVNKEPDNDGSKEDVKSKQKVEPKKEKPQEKESEPEEETETEYSEQEKDVKVTNYKTFFENYLVDDIGYTPDSANSIADFVLNHVRKFAESKDMQTKMARDLTEMYNRLKNAFPNVTTENKATKNYDLAMDNLSKISVLFNNWNKNDAEKMKSALLSLASVSESVQVQKAVMKGISKLTKKYKNE